LKSNRSIFVKYQITIINRDPNLGKIGDHGRRYGGDEAASANRRGATATNTAAINPAPTPFLNGTSPSADPAPPKSAPRASRRLPILSVSLVIREGTGSEVKEAKKQHSLRLRRASSSTAPEVEVSSLAASNMTVLPCASSSSSGSSPDPMPLFNSFGLLVLCCFV
jgi:hypothetical protein